MQIKSVPLQGVKAGPEDGLKEGEFIVYPSTFTKTPDSYGDVVAPGAFKETLEEWKESGNILPGLYGHRFDDPDYFVAGASDTGEDHHGWWVKGMFDMDSPKGPQVYRLVKGRRLNQLSFAFDVLDSGPVELEDGTKANELRKLKVYEFSFVPIGANQQTSVVAVKALTDEITDGLKAGRALSAKNESELRAAHAAIGKVLSSLGDAEEEDQEGKASGSVEVKQGASDEASDGKSSASGEEPKSCPSVERLAAQAKIYALNGAEGGSL
jgi:HK97 family phage prohead protease